MYSYELKNRSMILLFLGAVVTSMGITANPVQAETGKGEDVFKVIMTIFGVDKSKGDMVAIVSVNNSEVSRVKFLDSEAPYVVDSSIYLNKKRFIFKSSLN